MTSFGQAFTEKFLGRPTYDVGSIVMIEGRKAKITGGSWWGTHGLSNFWHWKFYGKNGKLQSKEHNGYGDDWKVIKK